jgi:hypothetical protein
MSPEDFRKNSPISQENFSLSSTLIFPPTKVQSKIALRVENYWLKVSITKCPC